MIDGFGKINEATTALAAALHHGHPGLRENSLRLAEGSTNPEIIDAVLRLASDPDPKVSAGSCLVISCAYKHTVKLAKKIISSRFDFPGFI